MKKIFLCLVFLLVVCHAEEQKGDQHPFDYYFYEGDDDVDLDQLFGGLLSTTTAIRPEAKKCAENYLPCPRSYPVRCILASFFCDNDPDCPNGEDEMNCPNKTSTIHCNTETHKLCDGVRCLPQSLWCDGIQDCFSNEDETNCTTPSNSLSNVASFAANRSISLEITRDHTSVMTGYDSTLTCLINGFKVDFIEWVHTEQNQHVLVHNSKLLTNDSRFQLRTEPLPPDDYPATLHNFNYSLTIKNITYDDAGVYSCRAQQNGSVTVTQHTEIFVPGAPLHRHRSSNFDVDPVGQLSRPRNNEKCCEIAGVNGSCFDSLCLSQDYLDWQLPKIQPCLSQAGSALLCLSGGLFNLPCCVRNGVNEKCLSLCSNQTSLQPEDSLRLALDCISEWNSIVSCFSETNRLNVEPPVGVIARAIDSNTIEVSWLAPLDAKDNNLRYNVFQAEVDPNDINPMDNDFTRMKTVSENKFEATNLSPLHRYAFFITTLASTGSVSRQSVIVEAVTLPRPPPTTPDDSDIENCCTKNDVHSECVSVFCTLNHTVDSLQNIVDHGLTCHPYVKQMFSCLAGERDHSNCCSMRHVPRNCLKFCVGHIDNARAAAWNSLQANDYACLPYLGMMASCFAENRKKLPNPPQSLTVSVNVVPPSGDGGSNTYGRFPSIAATVIWEPPLPVDETNPLTSVTRYRISVTAPGSGVAISEIYVPALQNRYILMQPFATIMFNEMYIVKVSAENGYGYSLDVTAAFSTPELRANEVVDGSSITASMKPCCAETGVSRECINESCRPDTITNVRSLPQETGNSHFNCTNSYWRQFAYCGSQESDFTSCCRDIGVSSDCLKLCNVINLFYFI